MPAVNTGDVATPLASVIAVAVVAPPANVPFGSAAGAVKVTVTPIAGDPLEVTTAEKLPKVPPTGCGDVYPPLPTVIAIVRADFVPELLQLVKKAKVEKIVEKIKVDMINPGMLQQNFRFTATPLSAWPWRPYGQS